MSARDEYPEDSELGARRPVYYGNFKNGNGDVNKLVWAVAAFLAVAMFSLGGIVASKVWDISERVARIEATVQYLVNKP